MTHDEWGQWAEEHGAGTDFTSPKPNGSPTDPEAVVAAALQLETVPLGVFAAVDEPGAIALLGADSDDALIPAGGETLIYGDGGAGKTTLAIDLAFHLAAGDPWLGIHVPEALNILLIENEGPRPLYRRKLRRKAAGWDGSTTQDRIRVLETPWAAMDYTNPSLRDQLAHIITEHAIHVVIIGPVTRIGMNDAGTLQQVRDFHGLITDVGVLAGNGVATVLIHHENKGGQVSGAWEGAGDTMLHLTAQGPGKTRLFVQKARWSKTWHKQTLQLAWGENESFLVDTQVELDDDTIKGMILEAVTRNPGAGWTRIEEETPGMRRDRRRQIRDELLASRDLVNIVTDHGKQVLLDHVPGKRQTHLYVATDVTIQHLRPDTGDPGAMF